MRIALINRTPKFTPLMLEGVGKDEFMPLETPKGAPDVEGLSNYVYASTSLRPGFLYVINESDSDGWSEWEVGLGGWLKEIDKSQAESDFRKVTSDAVVIDQYVAEPTDVLWFAYSEIQWSADYFKSMRDDSSKRGTRMQKYDLIKHVNNESQNDAASWDIMKNNFLIIPENKLDYNATQQNYTIASFDETNNTESYKLDAILCLHDPVGVLEELSNYLRYLWIEMDSLLISMKTGITLSEAENCLRNNKDPRKLQNIEDLKQIEALYNIGVNLRGVAYANDKNREDLIEAWWGIDVKRLDKVLAVEDRLVIKKKIAKGRAFLVNFVDSDYYGKILDDYLTNCDENIEDAKYTKSGWLSQIGQMPNDRDALMETKEEASEWKANDDIGKQFIKDTLEGKNNIGKIFTTPTLTEQVEGKVNWGKYFAISDNFFEFYKTAFKDGANSLEKIVKVLNTTRIKLNGTMIVATYQITDIATEFRKTDIGRSDFIKKTLNINKKSIKAFKKISSKFTSKFDKLLKTKQITFGKAFQKVLKNDLLDFVDEFSGNTCWVKLLRNISMVNLAMTSVKIFKSDDPAQLGLNVSKFGIAIADAHITLRNVKSLEINSKKALKIFTTDTKLLAKRVGYAGALVDASEAAYNFWQRDVDAGMAYGGAAISGALGTLCILAVSNSWHPGGWALLILALALGIYANTLEDSPLETIAKNGVFGPVPSKWLFWSSVDFSKDKSYLELIHKHANLEVRKSLHKTGFSEWVDLPVQYINLLDILIGGRVQLKSSKEVSAGDGRSLYADKVNMKFECFIINEAKAELIFGCFLQEKDQVDYEIYYSPAGLGGDFTCYKPSYLGVCIEMITEKDKPTKAIITIPMHQLQHTSSGVLMIMARVAFAGGQYFPVPNINTPRYSASIIPMIRTDYSYGSYYTDGINNRVIIDTKQKLLNKKEWK